MGCKMRAVVNDDPVCTVAGLCEGWKRRHLLVADVGSQRVLHGGCSLQPAAGGGGASGPRDGGQGVMLGPPPA